MHVVTRVPDKDGITLILIYDYQLTDEYGMILIYDMLYDIIILGKHRTMIICDKHSSKGKSP